jgi:hypothetical protein
MEANLENNPNYLLSGVDEYIEGSKKITDRAGVMLGILAILITTLLVIKTDKPLSFVDSMYQYYVVLLLLGIAGFFYSKTFFRSETFMPINYILTKAREEKIMLNNQEKDLPIVKDLYEKAQKHYREKQNYMIVAHSFLSVSIIAEVFVFLVEPMMLVDDLHTSPIFATVVILLISVLAGLLAKSTLFARKSEGFGFGVTIVDKIHFVRDYDSYIARNNQQAQQVYQNGIPITPAQAQLNTQIVFTKQPEPVLEQNQQSQNPEPPKHDEDKKK